MQQNAPTQTTGSDGRPLMLTKNGYCVLDQRRWRNQQLRAARAPAAHNCSRAPSTPHRNIHRAPSRRAHPRQHLDPNPKAARPEQTAYAATPATRRNDASVVDAPQNGHVNQHANAVREALNRAQHS